MPRLIGHLVVLIGIACSPVLLCLAAPAGLRAETLEEGYEAWSKGDYAAALTEWQPLAEAGNADAQSLVGFMYYNAQGVERDFPQAFAWYRRAAKQGSVLAQNNLGLMYANGNGVRRDDVRALLWFSVAATTGDSHAARVSATVNRDETARTMSAQQIDQAQAMAWRCQQTKFKECD